MKNPKYNSENIDKALRRMEEADTLKNINRSKSNIMSFFDNVEEEHNLQKQQSLAELKKTEYLKKTKLLEKILIEKGTKDEIQRIHAIGLLIGTTDFFNLKSDRKKIVKKNMIWCNKTYKKYEDSQK